MIVPPNARVTGTCIAVVDSDQLAQLSMDGITLGTKVFNISLGKYFSCKLSDDAPVPDQIVVANGIVGARWIVDPQGSVASAIFPLHLSGGGGTISKNPWLNPIKVYVSPTGDDTSDGLGEDTAVRTGYVGYSKIVAAGGGALVMATNTAWGGPVPGQGMWIRGDGASVPGFLPAVSCVITGAGGPGAALFQRPGQSTIKAGATNNDTYPDRQQPGLWLVKTEHLITFKDFTFAGFVYNPFRVGWDYNRDSSGSILRATATQGVLNPGDSTITFTVTLPSGITPTSYAHATDGTVHLTVSAPSANQTFPPWRQGQIVRITSTQPNVPAGDYAVTSVAANLDSSADWSFSYNDGTTPGSPTSGPGSGISIQSHGCGAINEGEYLDLKVNGTSNQFHIPCTQYRVVAHTATTITVANPFAGTNNGIGGTFPATGTFANPGDIAHQERVYCPVQWPKFDNVSAQMPNGVTIDALAGSGPCFDFGAGISLIPQLDNSQFVGYIPADDSSYAIDRDRSAGVFMSPGSTSAPVGMGIRSDTCTAANGGYRILCAANTGNIKIYDFIGDVGVSAGLMPPAVYAAGNPYTTVDVYNAIQTDTNIENVILEGFAPGQVRVRQCGLVRAPGLSGDYLPGAWATYPSPPNPFTQAQVVTWGDGTRLSGNHPAGRRTMGPVAARFANMVVDSSAWHGTGVTVTRGQPAPDGSNTAVKFSGSGNLSVRDFQRDDVNTWTSGGRFIIGGWFNAAAGLPGVGGGLFYFSGQAGLVFNNHLSGFAQSFAASADYVGNGWQWICASSAVVSVTTPTQQYDLKLGVLGTDITCWGLVGCYVPASVDDNDFYEYVATLKHQPVYLAPGMAGTMEGQKLIAHGGLGSAKHYVSGVASGQITVGSANGKYIELFDEAGTSLGVVQFSDFTVNP